MDINIETGGDKANVIARFVDSHAVELIQSIKEAAIDNQEQIKAVKDMLFSAQEAITRALKQLP
jgi:hypothetical protein